MRETVCASPNGEIQFGGRGPFTSRIAGPANDSVVMDVPIEYGEGPSITIRESVIVVLDPITDVTFQLPDGNVAVPPSSG
jgi:hypothetical protein